MPALECNYSKKIGLPGYSSHQFKVTLGTEISDLSSVHAESHHLAAFATPLPAARWTSGLKPCRSVMAADPVDRCQVVRLGQGIWPGFNASPRLLQR